MYKIMIQMFSNFYKTFNEQKNINNMSFLLIILVWRSFDAKIEIAEKAES